MAERSYVTEVQLQNAGAGGSISGDITRALQKLKLAVVGASVVAPDVKMISLQNAGGGNLPGFNAGAHIKIDIPDGTVRHYSLINLDPGAATETGVGEYVLGVRLEQDSKGGSKYMHRLAVGDAVSSNAPENDFPLQQSDIAPLLIAGGIGITPITAMLSSLRRQGQAFDFHYAGRTAGSLAFVEELVGLCGAQMQLHFDDDNSALDLKRLFGNHDADRPVYVCGPKGMIEAAKAAALGAGVASENIHFELFTSASQQAGDSSFEVELSSSGTIHIIPAGRTIIEVLEADGVDLIYDCQRGDCGICQVDVLEGIPDHRDVVLSENEKASNNVMQICVSRAKSKRLILDI